VLLIIFKDPSGRTASNPLLMVVDLTTGIPMNKARAVRWIPAFFYIFASGPASPLVLQAEHVVNAKVQSQNG
jgi:hypothetical protein